jgi:hypothetical protein
MKLAWLIAPVASLLLLGAHFLRVAAWPFVAACVVLVLLLAWRRPWVPRLVQVALALGTIEWAWTALILVNERIAEGRPWTRMAIILGAVALLTAVSALALQPLRRWYARRMF